MTLKEVETVADYAIRTFQLQSVKEREGEGGREREGRREREGGREGERERVRGYFIFMCVFNCIDDLHVQYVCNLYMTALKKLLFNMYMCNRIYSHIQVCTFIIIFPLFFPQLHGQGSIKEVRQYHFLVWPDHGVPQYATPLLSFQKRVRNYHKGKPGPMVVHCR